MSFMQGGNFIDPEGGLFVPANELKRPSPGHKTGEIRTHMTQSQAGLGTQGPAMTGSYTKPIPAPKDPEMPDG